MKKRKSHTTQEIEIPITDLSLESFREIIMSGQVEGEIPFDLLAEHYPELLSEWYPGYPGDGRCDHSSDPIPVQCRIEKGKIAVVTPGLEWLDFPEPAEIPDGIYYAWLKTTDEKTISFYGFFDFLDEDVQATVDIFCSQLS